MSVDDEMIIAISSIALGLHNEMLSTGRSMSAEEVAAVAMAISLQQSAAWLSETLDWNKEDRLDMALELGVQYRKLTGQ